MQGMQIISGKAKFSEVKGSRQV